MLSALSEVLRVMWFLKQKKEKYYDEILPIITISGKGSTSFHSGFIDDDGSVKFQLSQCTAE